MSIESRAPYRPVWLARGSYRAGVTIRPVRRWLAPGAGTAVAGGAAATVALTIAAGDGAPFHADLAVRGLVDGYQTAVGHRAAAGLTLLGSGAVLYPVLLILCLVKTSQRRSWWELAPVPVLAAGQVLELVLFATLHRPVPSGAATTWLTTTYSSGHTAAAVLG